MRLFLWLGLSVLAAAVSVGALGSARAAQAMHPVESPVVVRAMRASADHYRSTAWLYQRAAKRRLTPTTYSYRRSKDTAYLQWTVATWQRHEFAARRAAIRELKRRLDLRLPAGPGLHASLHRRVAYARSLTLRLRQIYPGPGRSLASAGHVPAKQQLFSWQHRAAVATLLVARHATRMTLIGPRWLTDAFTCIHRYEGAWNSNTGNGYYGGLQMNASFMQHYGGDFVRRWGTADRWPAWAQIEASVRAYRSGRGFYPWPNTARACGLL